MKWVSLNRRKQSEKALLEFVKIVRMFLEDFIVDYFVENKIVEHVDVEGLPVLIGLSRDIVMKQS